MKTILQQIRLAPIAVAALLVMTPCLHAAEADAAVQKQAKKLLTALMDNDAKSFAADGTEQFKTAPPEVVASASHMYGTRLKTGYELTYLTELKQKGCEVYLWKIVCKDGGDDLVARLVLKGDKVAGFFFQ